MQMTPNYSYLFPRPLFPPQSRSFSLWPTKSLNGCHPTFSVSTLPNPSKTEFIIIGLPAQIKKIPDPSIHLSNNSPRAVKSCQKTHPGNRSRQHRLTVYT